MCYGFKKLAASQSVEQEGGSKKLLLRQKSYEKKNQEEESTTSGKHVFLFFIIALKAFVGFAALSNGLGLPRAHPNPLHRWKIFSFKSPLCEM